jgi:hypothetical protein
MAPNAQMEELERLQRELATRESVLHFAQCGVSMVVALIFAGASGKLFWDSIRFPWLAYVAAAISVGAVGYSLLRYRRGCRTLRWELEHFAALKALRQSLRLDDPSALLPR